MNSKLWSFFIAEDPPVPTHRHFLIVIGRWKFEDWHLYRLRWHFGRKNRWQMWDRVGFPSRSKMAKLTAVFRGLAKPFRPKNP